MPFAFENSSPELPDTLLVELEVVRAPESEMVGRVYQLTRERTSVGRASCANIKLTLLPGNNQAIVHMISRVHSAFVLRDGRFWVEDMGSSNGTWMNGEVLTARALRDGDLIDLGTHIAETGERTPPEVTLRFRVRSSQA
jgi:pSer/pThr/pTyr-binding forkhead associated (FHA) protein